MGQTRVHTPVMREETREALGHQKYQKHEESDTDQPWANQKPFSASIITEKLMAQWFTYYIYVYIYGAPSITTVYTGN